MIFDSRIFTNLNLKSSFSLIRVFKIKKENKFKNKWHSESGLLS